MERQRHRRPVTRRFLVAGAAAAALVAAACNSTTRVDGDAATLRTGGDSTRAEATGDGTVSGATDTGDLVAGDSGAGTAATGGTRTRAGPTAGGSTATGGSQARPAGAGGQIKIGLHVSEDLQAAYAAFGAQGAEGDIRPALEKVVTWINAHGGLGGRTLVPVFHGSDALNGSFDSQAEAACAHFTDDDPVFAVVSGAVLPSLNLPDCLAKKRTPLVWNYHYLIDKPLWDRYLPYLYTPFNMSAERLAAVYADELVSAGFFPTGEKVGIVRYDNPQHKRFSTELLRPRLQGRGVIVSEEIAIRQPPSAAAAGDTAAQIGNAILQLRSTNVSRVVFVPTGGAVPFIFMSEAEGQGYRPKYAMNTLDIPFFVSDQAPPSQLAGAVAVGWSQGSDVRREQEPPRPASELCYGLTNSRTAQRFCDGLFFLKAALDRVPGPVDAAGLRAAVEGLGTGFDPVFSLATRFGPGRHDGASAVRLVTYDVPCECFRYTGPVRPVG